MGVQPILPVKVSMTIETMFFFFTLKCQFCPAINYAQTMRDTVCTTLENVGLQKSANRQKGGVYKIFSVKGVLIKRVGFE